MKTEYGIILVVGILVSAIFGMIVIQPEDIPCWRPLESFTINKMSFSDDSKIFSKIKNLQDSSCYTSPNENQFCYKHPRIDDRGFGISVIYGENRVDGEMHFDPVSKGVDYFTISDMKLLDKDSVLIILEDKNYSYTDINGSKHSIGEFEYSMILEPFDSFISHCHNDEGTIVMMVQYLGVATIDDIDYFVTWHTTAHSEQGIPCKYPDIMQQSLVFDFGEL
ncbi:hypothetical protein [Nitrosopumilus piranensis]|uniref:Uncharacterized protein n=1 Tax=Nitrosopumilus piranensis TaxID=1582439 RepID=A0A0C5BUW1_9ARCH|nr:hypothetical protein [Nitrosopumilus piranensis]AJM91999.1 hypothetical protein NPIRD3C_0787 [Nitrosopumilus piranensis]